MSVPRRVRFSPAYEVQNYMSTLTRNILGLTTAGETNLKYSHNMACLQMEPLELYSRGIKPYSLCISQSELMEANFRAPMLRILK